MIRVKMPSASKQFLLGQIAWLLGIAYPLILPTRFSVGLIVMLVVMLTLSRHQFCLRYFCLLSLAYCLASIFFYTYLRQITPQIQHGKQNIELTFTTPPTKRDDHATYLGATKAGWLVSVTVKRNQLIKLGSEITLLGNVEPIDTTGDIQRQRSAARNHLFARMLSPAVLQSQPARLSLPQHLLLAGQLKMIETANHLFPPTEAALFSGIIAGFKNDIPSDVTQAFTLAGLSHVIAVSGFNVTVVMTSLSKLTKPLGRWPGFIVASLAIVFVIVFTGATASVVRAGILVWLICLGRFIGRRSNIPLLLVFTATLMTLQNPLVLRYDIGFQLSFMALIGLLIVATPIQKRLERYLPTIIAETLAATIGAQLTTLPIINHYFGNLSPYSLIANLLVVPLIGPITLGGIPLVLAVNILPYLAWLSYPFELALHYIIWIVTSLSFWPGASLTLPPLPWYDWLLYSFILVIFYQIVQTKE